MAESEDGGLLGYAGLHVVLDEGYIDNIAVDPNARRHGVADELLDVFCRFGAANLAFLTLEVRASNEPAIALYRKHGFEEAGRRKDYYTKDVYKRQPLRRSGTGRRPISRRCATSSPYRI